jgi:hypothetical protein
VCYAWQIGARYPLFINVGRHPNRKASLDRNGKDGLCIAQLQADCVGVAHFIQTQAIDKPYIDINKVELCFRKAPKTKSELFSEGQSLKQNMESDNLPTIQGSQTLKTQYSIIK